VNGYAAQSEDEGGTMIRRLVMGTALVATLALSAMSACSSGTEESAAVTGAGAGAGSSGTNSGGAGFTGQGGSVTAAVGQGSGSGGLDECAGETHIGKQVPLDLVIMLDKSGSMKGTVNNITLWTLVTDALTTFVQSNDSEGIGVGLNYFPLADGVCTPCTNGQNCPGQTKLCLNNCCAQPIPASNCSNENMPCPSGGYCFQGQCWSGGGVGTCKAPDYAALDVPIALLPGVASSVVSSIGQFSPDGLTPTGPALQGAIDAAYAHAQANPNHVVAVVLATDGVPSECSPQDVGQIASIASTAFNGSPQVLTFVIGIGDLSALNQIAQAGSGTNAFVVDPNANPSQQFLDAMNAIRGSLLGCEYDIPKPEMGELDYGLVNVEFTPEGQMSTFIPQVASADKCDAAGGWYYDDVSQPTKILLCPATCDEAKSFMSASIKVVLGCETILK
ncbi:MAG: VWA domain-containing protein, partial [Polyangiaceae bacterium]